MFKNKKNKKHGVGKQIEPDRNSTELGGIFRGYSDELPSIQSALVRNTDINDPYARWLHTKHNPQGYKFTYGIVNKILNTPPNYFIYANPESEDFTQPDVITSMDYVHKKWNNDGMHNTFREALSQAFGVNSACIVKVNTNNGGYKFLVFNTSHIKDGKYYRDPITREITKIEFEYKASGGGYIEGSAQTVDSITITAEIGINAVLITPIQDVDDAFGRTSLINVWNMIVYRALNRYYNMVYNKKAGITTRLLIAPDDMITSSQYKNFEKEAKKGIESELMTIGYPTALANNSEIDPSSLIQWVENTAQSIDFNSLDEMLSKDSAFPPQFTEGVISGALGGVAPTEENKTINKLLMSYIPIIDQAIKQINTVFYNIKNVNYICIPYLSIIENNKEESPDLNKDDETDSNKENDEIDSNKEEQDIKKNSWLDSKNVKFRKISGNSATYRGNLWQSGMYEYEDEMGKYYEYLEPEVLQEFIDNKYKRKEAYLSVEHPGFVDYENAVAIIKVVGSETINGRLQDITEITFKDGYEPESDEINLSPVYSHYTEHRDGKLYQTDLDLQNAGMVFYPRSALTDLETKAIKVE